MLEQQSDILDSAITDEVSKFVERTKAENFEFLIHFRNPAKELKDFIERHDPDYTRQIADKYGVSSSLVQQCLYDQVDRIFKASEERIAKRSNRD